MRKNIALICVSLAAAIAAQGCIDTKIDMSGRSFKELCEMSGGQPISGTVCSCGYSDEDKKEPNPCAAGVVCINDGVYGYRCASGSLVDQPCTEKDAQTCEDIDGSGYDLVCSIQGGELKWSKTNTCKNEADNDIITSCKLEDGMSKCGECLNGKTQCGSDAEEGSNTEALEAEIQTCVNGIWQSGTCDTGLCKNGICVECVDNESECIGNTIYECRYGKRFVAEICQFGCKQVNEEIAECNVGCIEGNKKCESDTLYTCQNGIWEIDKGCVYETNGNINGMQYGDPVSCNLAGDDCGVCKNGAVYCKNSEDETSGTKMVCQNGAWSAPVNCVDEQGNGKSCASSTSCGECINGASKCDNNMHFTCSYGNWIMDKVCEFGCDKGTSQCNKCADGTMKCENDDNGIAKYSVCKNGAWIEKSDICTINDTTDPETDISKHSCAFNDILECVKDESGVCKTNENNEYEFDVKCGECKNNSYQCSEVKTNDVIKSINVKICVDGKWTTKPDASACVNGPEDNVGILVGCDENGNLDETQLCLDNNDNKFSCRGNECGVCLNGTLQCNSDDTSRLDVCRNGTWEFANFCESGICQEGKCIECKVGDTKCENGVIYSCENGKWGVYTSICKAKEENVKYTIELNDFVSCNLSNECGECKDGDFCYSDENNTGYRITCQNGTWNDVKKPCSNDFSCKSEYECGECINDTTECVNEKIRTCKNGQWDEYIDCPDGNSCKSATTCGDCINASTECSNGKIRTCMNAQWGEYVDCPNGADCKSDAKTCGECNEEEISYCVDENTYVKNCYLGEWRNVENCKANEKCHKSGDENPCGNCNAGNKDSVYCENDNVLKGKILKCSGTNWDVIKYCDDVSCGSNGNCGDCLNGVEKYEDTEQGCVYSKCMNGIYNPIEVRNVSCLSNGFGECLNGWFDNQSSSLSVTNPNAGCTIQGTMFCKNGEWVSLLDGINETVKNCGGNIACVKSMDNKYVKCDN